jgi:hypothetical protein
MKMEDDEQMSCTFKPSISTKYRKKHGFLEDTIEPNRLPITHYIDPRNRNYNFPTLKLSDEDVSLEFDEVELNYV